MALANAMDTMAAAAVAQGQWTIAARAAAAAAALRDRIHMAPWPLIREYHDASVHIAQHHLGIRGEALAAAAATADPWTVVEETLTGLGGRTPAGDRLPVGHLPGRETVRHAG